MSKGRNTTRRDMIRKAVRQRDEPCHICGGAIDYNAPHLSPGEFVIDHVIPLSKGGADALHNCRAAHRACNRTKGDKLPYSLPPRGPVVASDIW